MRLEWQKDPRFGRGCWGGSRAALAWVWLAVAQTNNHKPWEERCRFNEISSKQKCRLNSFFFSFKRCPNPSNWHTALPNDGRAALQICRLIELKKPDSSTESSVANHGML